MSTECRPCQSIADSPLLDTEIYSLQGLPERPVSTSTALYSNSATALGVPVSFTGTLDQWLVLVGTQLGASGGSFVGSTQAEADAAAEAALAVWVAESQADGSLTEA
jgi:hypothetical protein